MARSWSTKRPVPTGRSHAGRAKYLYSSEVPSKNEPTASLVAGLCWVLLDFNLKMLGESAANRCLLRYATLLEAQLACGRGAALQHGACRGITRDNGLRCGVHGPVLRFELRSQHLAEHIDGRAEKGTSWLKLSRSPRDDDANTSTAEMGKNGPEFTRNQCARRAQAFLAKLPDTLRAKHARRRSEGRGRLDAQRSRLAGRCRARHARTRSSDWRVLRSDAEMHRLLNGRPECPSYPAAFAGAFGYYNQPTCCTADVARQVYDPCNRTHGSVPLASQAALAQRAASALAPLRLLVVGDSVQLEWTAAMMVDLSERGLFGEDLRNGSWVPFRRPSGLTWCQAPLYFIFDARNASSMAPQIAYMDLREEDPKKADRSKGCECACGSPHPNAKALGRTLRHYQPDVVVMNYGVHYNGAELPGGAYHTAVKAAMRTLSAYAQRQKGGARGQPPLLLWRETLPQHFDGTPRGDGGWSSRQQGVHQDPSCAETRWRESQGWLELHEGPVALNRLARNLSGAFPRVTILPGFEQLGARHDGHQYKADCTHWCYAPLLWDAVLMPFYAAVVAASNKGWNRTARSAALHV